MSIPAAAAEPIKAHAPPPCCAGLTFAYTFTPQQAIFFRKEQKEVIAAVYERATQCQKKLRIHPETFAIQAVPTPLRSSHKKTVQWLIDHAYSVSVEGDELSFIPPEDPPSASTSGEQAQSRKPTEEPIDVATFTLAIQYGIKALRREIFDTIHHNKDLTCPITHSLFVDPVSGECGHTFEKSAINVHFETSRGRSCPECRKELEKLSTNWRVKNLADSARAQFPVPTPLASPNDNQKKCDVYRGIVRQFIDAGEYKDALSQCRQMLNYTNKSEDYAQVPFLLEKNQEKLKAAFANLCLAELQLKEHQVSAAKKSFKKGLELSNETPELKEVKAQYLTLTQQLQKGVALYQEAASDYKNLGKMEGHSRCLQKLVEADQKRSFGYANRVFDLLRRGKLADAAALDQAYALKGERNLWYHLANTALQLEKAKNNSERVSVLSKFIPIAEKHQRADLVQKACYEGTKLLVQRRKWEEARKFSLKGSENIPILKLQQDIYHHLKRPDDKQAVQEKLAALYVQTESWEKAEAVYRSIYKQFGSYASARSLGELLDNQKRTKESVKWFLRAADAITFQGIIEKEDRAKVDSCIEKMRVLDPTFKHLTATEKTALRTHLSMGQVFQVLYSTQQELAKTQRRQAKMETRLSKVCARVISLEKTTAKLSNQLKQQCLSSSAADQAGPASLVFGEPITFGDIKIEAPLPSIAFGKAKWEKHFGDIGVEPPLPSNINAILNSPCPFWPPNKVKDTHLLVLIPETVNGKPFHLDALGEMIQTPKTGHKTKCRIYSKKAKQELGKKWERSHWVLMTRDVIPGSRSKRYEDQKVLVKEQARKSGVDYTLPKALAAATAILMEHASTGTRLYPIDPRTYICCQEKVGNSQWPVAIGAFGAGGLAVNCRPDWDYEHSGVAAQREFR